MARGDVISVLATGVAQDAYVTVQPGAGEEWLITGISSSTLSSGVPNVYVELTSGGSNYSHLADPSSKLWNAPFKFLVTNTVYIMIQNKHTGAANIGYCGIKLK